MPKITKNAKKPGKYTSDSLESPKKENIMDIIKNISAWIRGLTEIGLSVLMLGVVFQIIFGANVVFLPIDILGNVISFVKALGSEGLVGLIALWILWGIYDKK